MKTSNRLTIMILAGLMLGIVVGYVCHLTLPDPSGFADAMNVVTTIFLRLVKMIIAPLVLATLVVGIARMGDVSAVGRIGTRTMAWFLFASLVSLSLGLTMVNLLRPGDNLAIALPAAGASSGIVGEGLSIKAFVTHLVPASVVDGMARNEILQIVVFSLFLGVALASVGEKAKVLVDAIDGLAHAMLKVTSYVMVFAPLAVFAAVAGTISTIGLKVLATYGVFMLQFYASIALLWLILALLGMLFLGRGVLALLGEMRQPLLLAFTTASSEAAYPKTLEGLERFGVNKRIASFVLPIGYSFNLDGSMMYCTFATVFIAQAYGIEMPLGQQMTMMLVLMLTSKGMAGVPRASLVVIAATLNQFGIPEAGLLLLLGVDHFLDMARSATNVVGNGIATAIIARWEARSGNAAAPAPQHCSTQAASG
ncbi:MAG: dicarboxylate/amino acid:cation symporter [Burkholderiaceae bacterium]|nr:dicarboxylate/amino acid:cation symporter [Burkholderiaceae bacterium]